MTAQDIVKMYIPVTLGVIMLAMGLGLRGVDFKRVCVEPRAILLGCLNQLVVLPALGFAFAFAFALPPALAVGLVLLTACPGGPSSNLYTNLARGDTALSVSLTAVSGVVTMVTIPLIANLALTTFMGAERGISLPVGETMLSLLLIVGAPLGVGMFVRFRRPVEAIRLERWMKQIAVVMLAGLIIGAIAKEWARVTEYIVLLGGPVVALSFGGMAIGFASAWAARLSIRQAVTITIEVGMQNAALAMGIAMTSLGSEEIAMPAVVYGIVAYFTCAVAVAVGRRAARVPQAA